MSQVKLKVQIGAVLFEAEGEAGWVSKQLESVLARSATHASGGHKTSVAGGGTSAHTKLPATTEGMALGAYLKSVKAVDNQTRKFLATAAWLHAKGQPRLSTKLVTQALSDSNQNKLGNASQCLAVNVKHGYCERDKNTFYVTDQGKEQLAEQPQA